MFAVEKYQTGCIFDKNEQRKLKITWKNYGNNEQNCD